MASASNNNSPERSGFSTFVAVLFAVIGCILTIAGLILGMASIGLFLEGDSELLVLLPLSACMMAGGTYTFIEQFRPKYRPAALPAASQAPAAQLEEPQRTAALPAPQAKATEKAPAATDASDDISSLIRRSDDVFATLKDLVRHDQAGSKPSDKHHLVSMLEATGLMEWEDAPTCEAGKLSRTDQFWIRQNVDGLTSQQYDTLVSAEAALGVNQALPEARSFALDDERAKGPALKLLRDMCEQTIERSQLTEEGLRVCYHDANPADTPEEWVVRSTICNVAECLRTPFRVVYDLRTNVEEGLVVLGLELPRPACMAVFTTSHRERAALARAYAFRLAALFARHAFDASGKISRVVINGHEHGSETVIFSLDARRAILASIVKVARSSKIESAFPTDESIRVSFDGAWFAAVEPFVALDDPLATPAQATVLPELDTREAPPALAQACHAKRICDLGINENAIRIAAWSDVRSKLGSTTEQAVSALVAARNAAHDITVAEACNRVVQALVDGKVDLDNLHDMASLFIDGSSLDQAAKRASELLGGPDGTEEPENALKILESALAPFEDMGVYLDDNTCVYRYFGSVSERIHHNAVIDEGGREIRLVPDSYFNAHSDASIALGMLGRYDEAAAHADICMRLAPTSTYATMRKVRILEAQSRIYEAADLIIESLRHAVTPRDAAICLYRLAYMEWKLGREDLAAACYQRSMNWDTEMQSQAREELNDLLESAKDLERPTDEQADALLAREGIPLGCVRTDGEHTLAAAVACMDAHAFLPASPLMAVLFGMNGDDVVMGIYRSLKVSV
ncbi:MAG: tetratricopeptide repeat protein [Atopobiaceae bacterium]|nr:tetratricopeptide repeat protein [Atopobiaceae bacterium]